MALKDHNDFGDYAGRLLVEGFATPRQGVDAGDHPPITPVKVPEPGQLGYREAKIYDFITSNFLACISEDAVYEAIRAEMLIGDEVFKLKGQHLLKQGFVEVMPWQRHGDAAVPRLETGDLVYIKDTRITEHVTDPPGFLTEAELIEKMEKYGIGTDASIPTHINNIIDRAYVTV